MKGKTVAYHDPLNYKRVFVLDCRPSHEPHVTALLFLPDDRQVAPLLRRVTHHTRRSATPGFEVSEAELTWAEYHDLQQRLGQAQLRLDCPNSVGPDGTHYSLDVHQGHNKIHFSWSEEPTEWAAMTAWYSQTWDWFNKRLKGAEHVLLPLEVELPEGVASKV